MKLGGGGLGGRLARLFVGLALFGFGVALMSRSRLGVSPWDVLHDGIATRLGLQLGWVVIGVGAAALAVWPLLGERVGIGTVSNVVVVGLMVNASLAVLPESASLVVRWAYLLSGTALIAVATALYIGARLGPGPRDGIMTGLVRAGLSVRAARTGIEVAVLGLGALLGGRYGPGTVVFAVAIGPLVHTLLPKFDVGETWIPAAPDAAVDDVRVDEEGVTCAVHALV